MVVSAIVTAALNCRAEAVLTVMASFSEDTVTFRSWPAAWWRSCSASVLGSPPPSGV